ncbi:MAG: hypothetical protein R3C44_19580 [Chloroflexota bacterium]
MEDSRNGLLAATAGMKTIVTFNQLTQNEDFSEASIVVSNLGDPDGETTVVTANRTAAEPDGYISVDDLEAILAGGKGMIHPLTLTASWKGGVQAVFIY